jgi:hypothetical protein
LTEEGYQHKQFRAGDGKAYYWINVKLTDWKKLEDEAQRNLEFVDLSDKEEELK